MTGYCISGIIQLIGLREQYTLKVCLHYVRQVNHLSSQQFVYHNGKSENNIG